MADSDPAILRGWKIFAQSTDEELDSVVHVSIFETKNVELGAFVLSTKDEVFYVGGEHPFFGSGDCTSWRLIDGLSGLGLKKVEVGEQFCVALTNDSKLWLWGKLTQEEIPASAYVCYYKHDGITTHDCELCSIYDTPRPFGGLELGGIRLRSGCARCGRGAFQTCELDQSDSSETIKLVNFAAATIQCTKCRRRCTPYKIGRYNVNYCAFCNYLPQDAKTCIGSFDVALNPELMDLGDTNEVVDVACGNRFFVALNKKNDLILWGMIDGVSYKGLIYNPDQVKIRALSCGGNHIAVVSVEGDLYTCGSGDMGQLGYDWELKMGREVLRQVPLGGKVLKVCCGYSSTLCLMDDGSLKCFGSHMKLQSPDVLVLNQLQTNFITRPARILLSKKVTDVACSSFTNVYTVKTDPFVFTWGRETDAMCQPELVPGEEDMMAALKGLPAKIFFKTPRFQQSTISPHCDLELYGKKFLSDLTLKLSDGDFPAHRLILHTNSVYFRQTFEENDDETVLDMTSYNPEAYKCLLKYFYGVSPTELNAIDLLDLYMLASSYKETAISQEVFAKLKLSLNPDTALPLLRKAKAVNCLEFLEVCNSFIQSPDFKHILAEKVSKDLEQTLSVLEVINNKTTNKPTNPETTNG